MNSEARTGRSCSRVTCRSIAAMTLTYIYSESTAVLGPLATFSEPHSYDLCEKHSARLTVPNGWNVIKQAIDEAANSQEETIREVSSRYASLFPLIKYLDTMTLQVPAQDLAEHPVRYQIA